MHGMSFGIRDGYGLLHVWGQALQAGEHIECGATGFAAFERGAIRVSGCHRIRVFFVLWLHFPGFVKDGAVGVVGRVVGGSGIACGVAGPIAAP